MRSPALVPRVYGKRCSLTSRRSACRMHSVRTIARPSPPRPPQATPSSPPGDSKLGIRHERIEPGKPSAEWPPRAHASHSKTRHRDSSLQLAQSPAARLRSLSPRVQRTAPARSSRARCPADFYCRSARRLPEPYWGRDFDYPEEHERARVLTDVSASAVTHFLARSRRSPLLHIGCTSATHRPVVGMIRYRFVCPWEKGSGRTAPLDAVRRQDGPS